MKKGKKEQQKEGRRKKEGGKWKKRKKEKKGKKREEKKRGRKKEQKRKRRKEKENHRRKERERKGKREENEKKRGNGNSTRENIELATINKSAENACVKVDFNIEHIYFIQSYPTAYWWILYTCTSVQYMNSLSYLLAIVMQYIHS